MRLIFIIAILVVIQTMSQAQNLVLNGGFENVTDCNPQADVLNCPPWFTPTTGTPDNFYSCFPFTGVPYNIFGYQPAHSGQGYAGMITLTNSGGREYIEGKLSSPLLPGKKYYVEFYTSVSDYSAYGIDAIGIHFSNNGITDYSGFFPQLTYNTDVVNPVGNVITDTLGWTMVSDTFTAQGGEQYITIGNFSDNQNTNTAVINPSYSGTYMYIDDVAVYPAETTEFSFFIPNAYSPNGDGNNDLLFVRGKNLEKIHLSIYSRWGEKVFETQNINEGWDGTFRGQQLETAVFAYTLSVTYSDGNTETKSGNISLVR